VSTNTQIGNSSGLPCVAGNTLANQIYKNPTTWGSFRATNAIPTSRDESPTGYGLIELPWRL